MKINHFIFIILFLINFHLLAQTEIDSILFQIEKNNKTLVTARKHLEADIYENKTGLFPQNPDFTYGYFSGSNSQIGDKEVVGISQNFDFPLTYLTNDKISKTRNELSTLEYQVNRQDLLLKAKLLLYEYVFKQKQLIEFKKRLRNATKLNESNKQQFALGNISIIEVNKSNGLLVLSKTKYYKTEQELRSLEKELLNMNGGSPVQFTNIEYEDQILLSFDSVKIEFIEGLPQWKYLEQNLDLALLNKRIKKQYWFPEFQIGYQAEKESSGSFRGIHAGMSIPLWNNINTVRSAKARVLYSESKLEESRANYLTSLETNYEKAKNYQVLLADLENTMESVQDISKLNKAFDEKEISVIEYFNELSFYNELIDLYLETEKEYYQSLVELYYYKL